MALIENAKGRRENQAPGGYTRLFGIEALGNLMSRIQGAVISSGTELETLIWERCKQIDNLDEFVAKHLHQTKQGIFVARKDQVKKSQSINSRYEPDFLGFDLLQRICYIIEIKDGDQFDTKKAAGEHTMLHNFTNDISQALPFSTKIYLCSFNSRIKDEIYNGLKRKFSKDELITGQELCLLFGIDYDEIVQIRTSDQQKNLDYFIRTLLSIDPVRVMMQRRLKD